MVLLDLSLKENDIVITVKKKKKKILEVVEGA